MATAGTPVHAAATLPVHLPAKLSICCWIWSWITSATEGEPYHDLDGCMAGLKERGFNAVRVEAGLNWAFRADGSPRGQVAFRPWIAGYGWNFSTVNSRGGGRHDVLQRLVALFESARRHGVYVILTSWEYQDSTSFLADPALRAEIHAVPPGNRYMHLAKLHDRLLAVLEERGLEQNVAFVEVHNEPDASEFPGGEEGRELHEEAIGFLRDRHPEVLITGDFTSHDYAIVPENVQVFDQHVYAGFGWYFRTLFGETVLNKDFDPGKPRALPALNRVLRKDLVPWSEFMVAAENVREFWRPIMWMYENLDNEKWDEWAAETFSEWAPRIREKAETAFASDAREGRRRGLPLVFDEGGYFYPPRLARFEVFGEGLSLFELMCDLAITHGYWGFMPGTYCGPEHLAWQENPAWLLGINTRFQKGILSGS